MQNAAEEEVDRGRAGKRAKTTKQATWADYKSEIYDLYAVQNYSIDELMEAMARKGLHASYVTKPPGNLRASNLFSLVP